MELMPSLMAVIFWTNTSSFEIPYQSTQFNKYYADYLAKANATMHLNHKPGEVMQVDWAGDTAAVIDTDTGEIIPAYVFVATLPSSGYSYVEAFFSMNQEDVSKRQVGRSSILVKFTFYCLKM